MMSFLPVILLSFMALLLIIWRLWPMLRGRVKPQTPLEIRADRWNRYLIPLFSKILKEKMSLAQILVFEDSSAVRHSLCTWSLSPSILPDTEYVSLVHPAEMEVEALGVIPARRLRKLLGGQMQSQEMWGHKMWVSLWPEGLTLEEIRPQLESPERFRARLQKIKE